jgi:hypothetical protein
MLRMPEANETGGAETTKAKGISNLALFWL